MSIEQQIKAHAKDGKSVEEVKAMNLASPYYVERIFKKMESDKPAEKKDDTPTPTIQNKISVEESIFDQQMQAMEDENKEKSNNIADALKVLMENPQSFLIALSSLTQKKDEGKTLVRVSKCHRHPWVDVKPGDNCQDCLQQCAEDRQREMQLNYVLPCPKCKDNKKQANGGYIKTFPTKAGHYSCGNCRISYNFSGECVPWGANDQAWFEKASSKGLY